MSATQKTPEQIASDTYWTISHLPLNPTGRDLRALMVQAIEADRAQRPTLITPEQAREWAGFDVDLDRLAECIPNSSIPDSINTIAHEAIGNPEESEESA